MINTNTFKFVGVSKHKGAVSVRYANSKSRDKVLLKNGHTGVRFIELEQAERQEDCVDALLNTSWVSDDSEVALAVAAEARRLGFVM